MLVKVGRSLLLVAVVLLLASCTRGRTDAQIAQDGQAEIARLAGHELTAAILHDGWTVEGERDEIASFKNNDHGRLGGTFGVTRTNFEWVYRLEPGVDPGEAVNAAVEMLRERHELENGSTLFGGPDDQSLLATAGDDRLIIGFRVDQLDGTVKHTITVRDP